MELLDDGTKLKIQSGNSANIPFVGWVNQEIQLESSDTTLPNIPLHVTSDYIERPILGFDVIKEMLQDNQQKDALVNILTTSFGKSSKVQTIFKSMRQENQSELVYSKKWMRVSTCQHKHYSQLWSKYGHVRSITPLKLKKVSVINNYESIETISNIKIAEAVTPIEGILSREETKIQSHNATLEDYSSDNSLTNHQLKTFKNFDLLGLTVQQQQVSSTMILKEADTLIKDDTEIGAVNTHKMQIQLKGQVPVP